MFMQKGVVICFQISIFAQAKTTAKASQAARGLL